MDTEFRPFVAIVSVLFMRFIDHIKFKKTWYNLYAVSVLFMRFKQVEGGIEARVLKHVSVLFMRFSLRVGKYRVIYKIDGFCSLYEIRMEVIGVEEAVKKVGFCSLYEILWHQLNNAKNAILSCFCSLYEIPEKLTFQISPIA